MPPPVIRRVHHVACRCRDALETVAFYRDVLGLPVTVVFAEDTVPSTGEPDPYLHVFLDAGMGTVLAFFELPERPPMGRDPNTPAWVQHLAFELGSLDELAAAHGHLRERGIDVVGPTDHGLFRSIYFVDPNGHRLELAVNTGTPDGIERARSVAPAMLDEWGRTRRTPRHTAWLHARGSDPAWPRPPGARPVSEAGGPGG